MRHLRYIDAELHMEGVALGGLAERFQTPLYVYSESQLEENFRRIDAAFGDYPHSICYAVKANSNLHLLRLLAGLGAGADVVSGGELWLAWQAGISAEQIVFAGVGKRDEEIEAAVRSGVRGLHVESEMELQATAEIAARIGKTARVALRINPNIDIHGHPYISTGRRHDKFGIELEELPRLFQYCREQKSLRLVGLHCHVGSQIADVQAYAAVAQKLAELAKQAQEAGHRLEYLDVGGGLGIDYESGGPAAAQKETDPGEFALDPQQVAEAVLQFLRPTGLPLIFEPGRAIAASAGILLTRVLYRKASGGKQFLIVDAGMNDLIRPSLYGAYHAIVPVTRRQAGEETVDIVGPICESGDFFARDRQLQRVDRGDLLAVCTAGAYGFTLASNYNARPLPAEVAVRGDHARLIRPRQRLEALLPQ